MPNPTGKNQLPGGPKEIPYGGVQKAQQLTREAPISGAPTSALNAPRRAQRRAVRGGRGRQPAQPKQPTVLQRPDDAFEPTSAPPMEPGPPGIAETWAGISQIPGVTPLAQDLARRALNGGV